MTTDEIIKARKGARLRDYDPKEANRGIANLLLSCFHAMGQKKESADLMTYAQQIYTQTMRLFSWLTLEEMALACQEAIFSGGVKFGINPQSVIQFIRDYICSEIYKKARSVEDGNVRKAGLLPKTAESTAGYEEWVDRELNYYILKGKFQFAKRAEYPRAVGFYPVMVQRGWLQPDTWKQYTKQALTRIKKADVYDKAFNSFEPELPTLEKTAKFLAVEDTLIRKAQELKPEDDGDLPL